MFVALDWLLRTVMNFDSSSKGLSFSFADEIIHVGQQDTWEHRQTIETNAAKETRGWCAIHHIVRNSSWLIDSYLPILPRGINAKPCHLVLCCRSTNTPRAAARKSAAAAAGFSFRLEERAEKRKEVCTIFPSGVLACFPFLVLKGLSLSLLSVLPKAWRENPCKGAWKNKFAGEI